MFFTIFKTTNTKNGKIYIGKHQTNIINDDYFGSGSALKSAVKKWGRSAFIKEILFVFDNEESMNAKEKELVTEEFVSRKDTYNRGVGGEGGPHFKGKRHSPETIEKIKEKRKNQVFTEEARQKISVANSKRKLSDETKKKLSEKAVNRFKKMTNLEKEQFSASVKKGMNIAR
jgi:hypothetical protein